MRTQLVAAITLSAVSLALLTTPSSQARQTPGATSATPKAGQEAKAPAATATEDIIFMRDGRELHGQIISEDSRQVVFEYHDPKINIKAKLTLARSEIAEIQRDIAVAGAPAADGTGPADAEATEDEDSTPTSSKNKIDYKPSYGAVQFSTDDPSVPSIYVVGMSGQFGTDVRAEVYKPVIADIRKHKPSLVVITLESADRFPPELMHPTGFDLSPKDPRLERSLLEFEDFRELIHLFRDEIRDIPQVIWVRDSDGISATIAMAWDKIYMVPEGRFGGLITVLQQSGAGGWADSDVRAKMMAAWLGMAKSFAEKGGYSQNLVDAMLQPEKMLSGTWEGRAINWSLDTKGEYIVDDKDEYTVDFTAKTAEDLCISQGTASDLDDLALLLGYREYRLIEGQQHDLTVGYAADWRRAFAQCEQWLKDYEKHTGWADEDPVKWIGKAKKNLEDVVRKLDQYKAVEIRLQRDFGVDRLTLITYIEQMSEQLQMLRKRDRVRPGGTGGGGGSGPGAGGG